MATKLNKQFLKGVSAIYEKLRTLDVPAHLSDQLRERLDKEVETAQKALCELIEVAGIAVEVVPSKKRAIKALPPVVIGLVKALQELEYAARSGSDPEELSPRLAAICKEASAPSLKEAARQMGKSLNIPRTKADARKTIENILSNAYMDNVTHRGVR